MMRPGKLLLVAGLTPFAASCGSSHEALTPTVAEVERIRDGIALTEPGAPAGAASGVLRLTPGASLRTDASGRALVTLDHGERVLVDHDSQLVVVDGLHLRLDQGRVWVSPPAGTSQGPDRAALDCGAVSMRLQDARASVARGASGVDVDVLGGEVVYRAGARQGAVHQGEHGVFHGADVTVDTHRLFDDWTGGLADEVPARHGVGDAVGLGAVAARRPDEAGAPRWPLVLQRVDAHVTISGDLAVTELEQVFFNPASDTVEGMYTLSAPRGAVLQRFAVDRRGTLVDGRVQERQSAAAQYQAQVYAGSPFDPALLEWDAPGRYHAKLFPIQAGATRRIVVTYTQWLTARPDGGRSYRLPLASLGTRVGELRADVDLSQMSLREVRASAGSVRADGHVTLSRSDEIPTADFVLDLRGDAPREATMLRVGTTEADRTVSNDRGGFFRLSVQAPLEAARTPRDEGLDLVLVVDHSAAMDAAALQLEQSMVDALTSSLTARDRFLVLAGDVAVRPLGSATMTMTSATPDARRAMMEALATDRRGGATDLGVMIQAAQGALDPRRNSAIVYLGDGNATVGEDALPALRARLARMNPRPRLYALAMGEAPRLDLLDGLTRPAGFSARVVDRGEIARTALDVIAHAARPLVRDFRADLGPAVERVYPTEPVDLPAGEPLELVGRTVGQMPPQVTVHARWQGEDRTRVVPITGLAFADRGDLKFRWANARLDHLLAQGEPRAVIVELGTRFGLITPFTSLYVPGEPDAAQPTSDNRDFSVFDLVPMVGCTRSSADAPAASAAAPTEQSEDQSQTRGPGSHAGEEGRMGSRSEGGNGRYALARRAQGAAQPGAVDMPANQAPTMPTTTVTAAPAPVAVAAPAEPEAAAAEAPPPPPTAMPMQPLGSAGQTAPGYGGGGANEATGARPHMASRQAARAIAQQNDALSALTGVERAPSRHSPSDRGREGEIGGDGTLRDSAEVAHGIDDNANGDVDEVTVDGDRFGANRELRSAPAARSARLLRRCSDAASVSLSERAALWRERLSRGGSAYDALRLWGDAKNQCELPSWSDQATLLRLMVDAVTDVDGQLALYNGLHSTAAKDWMRRALLRTMVRTGALARVSALGLRRLDSETLTQALATAHTPQERVNVLRVLSRRFPDDLDLGMLLLDAAVLANDAAEVRRTASRLREDPRADARTRTAVGEALLAVRDEAEARRAFSEIVEFAPDDPFARRRLGEIALSHGWAEEAYRQFQTLAAMTDDAPEILLRLAWAASAAGRLDEAIRLAERVTSRSTPGTAGDLSEVASAWVAAQLALAAHRDDVPRETVAALRARWRRSPAARGAGAVRVVLWWRHPDDDAELRVSLPGEPPRRADLVANQFPLESTTWIDEPPTLGLDVRRGGGSRPRGEAELLVIWNEGSDRERIARQTLSFDPEHSRFMFSASEGAITAVALPAAEVAR